jgi:hypothetical protein
MVRRLLTFWLTCVLIVAVVAAWNSWVLGNLEPDFGDAFGNFGTSLGIFAVLTVPAALCHGIAAFLLRTTVSNASPISAIASSAASGVLFVLLVFVTGSLPLDLPVKPLLLPAALGLLASLLVLAVVGKLSGRGYARAA